MILNFKIIKQRLYIYKRFNNNVRDSCSNLGRERYARTLTSTLFHFALGRPSIVKFRSRPPAQLRTAGLDHRDNRY